MLTAKVDVFIYLSSQDKCLFQIKYQFTSVPPLILHTHPKKPTHLPGNQEIYSKPLLRAALLLSVIILSSSTVFAVYNSLFLKHMHELLTHAAHIQTYKERWVHKTQTQIWSCDNLRQRPPVTLNDRKRRGDIWR